MTDRRGRAQRRHGRIWRWRWRVGCRASVWDGANVARHRAILLDALSCVIGPVIMASTWELTLDLSTSAPPAPGCTSARAPGKHDLREGLVGTGWCGWLRACNTGASAAIVTARLCTRARLARARSVEVLVHPQVVLPRAVDIVKPRKATAHGCVVGRSHCLPVTLLPCGDSLVPHGLQATVHLFQHAFIRAPVGTEIARILSRHSCPS